MRYAVVFFFCALRSTPPSLPYYSRHSPKYQYDNVYMKHLQNRFKETSHISATVKPFAKSYHISRATRTQSALCLRCIARAPSPPPTLPVPLSSRYRRRSNFVCLDSQRAKCNFRANFGHGTKLGVGDEASCKLRTNQETGTGFASDRV